jgi:anthranilate phosphoribosyltransferase
MSSTSKFSDVFNELTSTSGVTPQTVRRVFETILRGEWTPVQVAGLMVALRLRGESAETIAAAAQAMRGAMVAVEHDLPCVIDTCGTGGDGLGTLNLSTGAAIIVAACGVPVAKHGNRAVSSRAGSADVLEALGIPLDLPPSCAADILREANIAFLMAPVHHPAMKHAVQARRELGIRTLFNCLGPLANPARATHQLLGAYDDALRDVLARTLRTLGTQRAWVVHGFDGLDEISPAGPTRVTELDGTSLNELVVAPEDFGLEPLAREAIAGGDASFNAQVLSTVFSGAGHPATDAFVLNAAAALVVAQRTPPKQAADRAREALASGRARAVLETWLGATRRAKSSS